MCEESFSLLSDDLMVWFIAMNLLDPRESFNASIFCFVMRKMGSIDCDFIVINDYEQEAILLQDLTDRKKFPSKTEKNKKTKKDLFLLQR